MSISWSNALMVLAWVIPVLISLTALTYSQRALLNTQAEVLVVQVTNYLPWTPWPFDNYPVNIRTTVQLSGPPTVDVSRNQITGAALDHFWNCLITNVGYRTVSLVAFEVSRDGKRDLERSDLFLTPKEPAQLPLSIAPGEAKRLLLKLPVKLALTAIDVLYNQDKLVNPLNSDEVFNLLLRAGIDYYGNPLRTKQVGDGYFTFDIDTANARQEQFRLRLKTGGGTYVEDAFWWYKGPQF